MPKKKLCDLAEGDIVKSYFGGVKRVVDIFPRTFGAHIDWERGDGNIARTIHHYSEMFDVIERP